MFYRSMFLFLLFLFAAAGLRPVIGEDVVPFQVGEKLTYELRFLGARAGSMTSTVQEKVTLDGLEAYHIIVHIRTSEELDDVYRLNDEIHLYLNAVTLEPIRTDRFLEEGSWTGRIRVDFDQEARKAYYALWNGKGKFIEGKTLSLPPSTLDAASLAYFVRGKALAKLTSFRLSILYDKEAKPVEVTVTAEQEVDLDDLGVFQTYMLKGVGFGNVFLWISDDEHRLPVRMITDGIKISQDKFLPLEAKLVKVENL